MIGIHTETMYLFGCSEQKQNLILGFKTGTTPDDAGSKELFYWMFGLCPHVQHAFVYFETWLRLTKRTESLKKDTQLIQFRVKASGLIYKNGCRLSGIQHQKRLITKHDKQYDSREERKMRCSKILVQIY